MTSSKLRRKMVKGLTKFQVSLTHSLHFRHLTKQSILEETAETNLIADRQFRDQIADGIDQSLNFGWRRDFKIVRDHEKSIKRRIRDETSQVPRLE
jgi:hypothetical protein